MSTRTRWCTTVLVMLVAWRSAGAHHSASPHFDMQKTVSLSGVVTDFRFVNPHSYIYVDVPDAEGGKAAWRCELPGRTALERRGWSPELFHAGQRIHIEGSPARREARVCYSERITSEEGRRIARDADLARGTGLLHKGSNPAFRSDRNAVDAWGRPNLGGLWVGRGRPFRFPIGPPRGRPLQTAEGRKASRDYDQRFDDPALQCSPANIIFGWTHDQNVNQVVQARDAVTLRYGYMDLVRVIHLDMADHPKATAPSLGGHSIGRWEGATLVVDTVSFKAGVLEPMAGLLHSSQLHIVERFTVDSRAGTLTRYYRIEDPLYLQAPYEGRDVLDLTEEPYRNFDCIELSGKNNLRTTQWGRQ